MHARFCPIDLCLRVVGAFLALCAARGVSPILPNRNAVFCRMNKATHAVSLLRQASARPLYPMAISCRLNKCRKSSASENTDLDLPPPFRRRFVQNGLRMRIVRAEVRGRRCAWRGPLFIRIPDEGRSASGESGTVRPRFGFLGFTQSARTYQSMTKHGVKTRFTQILRKGHQPRFGLFVSLKARIVGA